MSNPISEAVLAERARLLERPPAPRRTPADGLEVLCGRMGEGLAYRMGGPQPDDDAADPFVRMRFPEMVAELLRFRGVTWATKSEMIARGIGTGDVAALLEGAGNRVLRAEYQSYAGGVLRVAGRIPSRDFRPIKTLQIDGDVALQEVEEGAAFAEGSVNASAEVFEFHTFGRLFGISRNLLLDDDLGAFASLSARLGRMASEFVSAKLAALLESNPTLADGSAAFDANHKNLGTGGALSETTVGELLKLVRNQTGLGGEGIAAVPKFIVVPSALEWTARKLVATLGPSAPFEVVVEPRLTSATAHYVVADPETVRALTYSYGGGSDGPTISIGTRRNYMGVVGKVVVDLACGFEDFRGAARNAGQ